MADWLDKSIMTMMQPQFTAQRRRQMIRLLCILALKTNTREKKEKILERRLKRSWKGSRKRKQKHKDR
jgi:hypothetical protein